MNGASRSASSTGVPQKALSTACGASAIAFAPWASTKSVTCGP
ncbi:MAG: hypothetical protein V9E83_12835 [Baekduia sp.]